MASCTTLQNTPMNADAQSLRSASCSSKPTTSTSTSTSTLPTEDEHQPCYCKNGCEYSISVTDGKPFSRNEMIEAMNAKQCWLSGMFPDSPVQFKDGMNGELATQVIDGEQENAIMKIYMQISGRPGYLPRAVTQEIQALERLRDVKDRTSENIRAPYLLGKDIYSQGEWCYVPDGGVVMIAMSVCPGEKLKFEKLFRRSVEERTIIRNSLMVTLRSLRRNGIISMDPGLHNLLWEKSSRQCYVVDFEGAIADHESHEDSFCEAREVFQWGLIGWQWEGRELLPVFGAPFNEPPDNLSSEEDGD